jgi:hypothetical protein
MAGIRAPPSTSTSLIPTAACGGQGIQFLGLCLQRPSLGAPVGLGPCWSPGARVFPGLNLVASGSLHSKAGGAEDSRLFYHCTPPYQLLRPETRPVSNALTPKFAQRQGWVQTLLLGDLALTPQAHGNPVALHQSWIPLLLPSVPYPEQPVARLRPVRG